MPDAASVLPRGRPYLRELSQRLGVDQRRVVARTIDGREQRRITVRHTKIVALQQHLAAALEVFALCRRFDALDGDAQSQFLR